MLRAELVPRLAAANRRAGRLLSSLLCSPRCAPVGGVPRAARGHSLVAARVLGRPGSAGGPGLSRTAFALGSLWELSFALCCGNASMCRGLVFCYLLRHGGHRSGLNAQAVPALSRDRSVLPWAVVCSCLLVGLVCALILGLCWGSWFAFVRVSYFSAWAFPVLACVPLRSNSVPLYKYIHVMMSQTVLARVLARVGSE
jgi:hypothetical protein